MLDRVVGAAANKGAAHKSVPDDHGVSRTDSEFSELCERRKCAFLFRTYPLSSDFPSEIVIIICNHSLRKLRHPSARPSLYYWEKAGPIGFTRYRGKPRNERPFFARSRNEDGPQQLPRKLQFYISENGLPAQLNRPYGLGPEFHISCAIFHPPDSRCSTRAIRP
jgi:hypothetical protein